MSATPIRDPYAHATRWMFLFVVVFSFFTYAYNWANPAALFWDENYHIASAQKYLNGVYFMEPHPPLGKLLIALGEKIVNANPLDNQFIGTDYAQNPPAGFSFVGYRMFPVLLGWLTAPLLFGIFLLLTRRTLWALGFSMLYALDNALIVHMRSAMLDSTMVFFAMLTVYAYLRLRDAWDDGKAFRLWSMFFGIAFACLMATKVFGLILILLIPALLIEKRKRLPECWSFLWKAGASFLIIYCSVWYVHFAIGSTVVPALPDQGYYQASAAYKDILRTGRNRSLLSFPIMLRDNIKFVSHYQEGVPRLDLCKKDENGSPWFFWPLGARTINYRWATPDGQNYQYLTLVANPVAWGIALVGLMCAALLLLSRLLLPVSTKLKHPATLITFSVIYLCYMIAVSRIDRVLYLYHYFIPLILSFLIAALVFDEIDIVGRWKFTEERKNSAVLAGIAALFIGFQFFHPFSYYELLSDASFAKRNLMRIWDLKCVRCQTNSMLVVPVDPGMK